MAASNVLAESNQRTFTDRRDAISAFGSSLLALSDEHAHVLNFHGVGGIGKSRLQVELYRSCVVGRAALPVALDLELTDFRHEDGALSQLRHLFRGDHGLGFPLFDIAFTVYRGKTQPNIALVDPQTPLLADSEILSTIIDVAGATPLVGHVVSLLKILDRAGRRATKFAHVRHDHDLRRLDSCSPLEVLHSLAAFLGKDLSRELARIRLPAVVFLDSYEALTRDATATDTLTERTAWVERLVYSLPNTLIVICSREPIEGYHAVNYVDLVTQHPLADLSPIDCADFLSSAGIDDPEVTSAIARASEGLPFYLQLAADHWGLAHPSHRPSREQFGAEPAALLRRFTGHLHDAERELLTVMAVPRLWDHELFRALTGSRGLHRGADAWRNLCCYSFTSATPTGLWTMHQLMRRTLLAQLDAEDRNEIETWLYEYYRARLDDESVDGPGRVACLSECAHHGVQAASLDSMWLLEIGTSLMDAGLWNAVAGVVADIRAALLYGGDKLPQRDAIEAVLRFFDGWILRQQGRLLEARQVLRAIDLSSAPAARPRIRCQLAHVEREAGETTAAGAIYAELFDQSLPPEVDELGRMSAVNYSDIRYVQGHFREAAQLLDRLRGLALSSGCEGEALRILGHVYRFSERRADAVTHYEEARAVFSAAGNEPGVAQAETNLAEALALIAPDDGLRYAKRAIEHNSDLGAQLEIGKAWNAMAHAHLVLGDLASARLAGNEAVRNQQEVGYRSGLARAWLTTALIIYRDDELANAREVARQAIQLFETTDTYPTCIVILSRLLQRMGHPDEATEAAAWDRIEPIGDTCELSTRLDDATDTVLGASS